MNPRDKENAKLIFQTLSSKIRTAKDYDYRSGNYSQIDGSICTNNNDFEGYAFGKYKCPIEGFSTEAVLCCDEPGSGLMCAIFMVYYNTCWDWSHYCCDIISRFSMLLSERYYHHRY